MLLPLIKSSTHSYAPDQSEETVDAGNLPQPIAMVPLSAPDATADKVSTPAISEKPDPGDQYEAILPYQEHTDLSVSSPLPDVYVAANIAADQDLYEDIHPVIDTQDNDHTELVYEDADESTRTFHVPQQRQIQTGPPGGEQLEAEDEYVINEPVYADAEPNALAEQPEEDYVINQLVYQEPEGRLEDYEALT